jgi:predicted NUDIX family phosphoesterase
MFSCEWQQGFSGKKEERAREGKFLGIGGRREIGKNIRGTTGREVEEEMSVIPDDMKKVAIRNFHFQKEERSRYNQKVHVFQIYSWRGKIEESEMAPT